MRVRKWAAGGMALLFIGLSQQQASAGVSVGDRAAAEGGAVRAAAEGGAVRQPLPSPSPVAAAVWSIAESDQAEPEKAGEKKKAIPDASHYLTTLLKIRGAEIQVFVSSGDFRVSLADLLDSIRAAVNAVSSYYAPPHQPNALSQNGTFPVAKLSLTVAHSDDADAESIHGKTFGGRRIRISLGPQVTRAQLLQDWVMTHEMLHLAFPEMDDDFLWLQEGMATYIEPLARSRMGTYSVEQYWRDLYHGLPNGLPREGDRGLLYTHTWGRTYWGGALFWFLADIEIREKTENRHSVDDVFREILKSGGNGRAFWKINAVLSAGDRATGKDVMHRLYDRLARHAGSADLDAVWKKLGVKVRGKEVEFDDQAPGAAIRVDMTKRGEAALR